jgi:hypothetical protein
MSAMSEMNSNERKKLQLRSTQWLAFAMYDIAVFTNDHILVRWLCKICKSPLNGLCAYFL